MALFRTTDVPSEVNISKRNKILIYTYTFLSYYSFLSLYVTLHFVVVRDTSNAEIIYNAGNIYKTIMPECHRL